MHAKPVMALPTDIVFNNNIDHVDTLEIEMNVIWISSPHIGTCCFLIGGLGAIWNLITFPNLVLHWYSHVLEGWQVAIDQTSDGVLQSSYVCGGALQ